MKRIKSISLLAALVAGLSVMKAEAHHSFAMYDLSQTKTFTGKLSRFIPGANHAQLYFELIDDNGNPMPGDDGNPAVWGVEMGPASQIAGQGITVKAFPLGSVITVTLNPLRDGRPFGSLAGPVIKCGMAMPAAGCTAESGESFGGR